MVSVLITGLLHRNLYCNSEDDDSERDQRIDLGATLCGQPFADPSIAVAAFGAGPQELIDDLPTMGYLFENMAVRDLRIYTDALDGKVYHYLDRNGREVDAIIRLRNGRYGLVEIKLGGDLQSVDEGAANLIKFASLVNTDRSPAPSFMMVLTGLGQFAYRREDGVCVVPLGTLKP